VNILRGILSLILSQSLIPSQHTFCVYFEYVLTTGLIKKIKI